MRKLRLSLSQLSEASGAPVSTLRNWVDKRLLDLDADALREEGKHRRFSGMDAIKVLIAHNLSSQGVSAAKAAAAAKVVAWYVIDCLSNLTQRNGIERALFVDVAQCPPELLATHDPDRPVLLSVAVRPIFGKLAGLLGGD